MLSGLHSGTLWKRGPKVKDAFKKRHFILNETSLRYYSDDKTTKLCGTIELAKVRNIVPHAGSNSPPKEYPREFLFSIDVEQEPGEIRDFVLCAISENAKNVWLDVLDKALAPFRTMAQSPMAVGAAVQGGMEKHIQKGLMLKRGPKKNDAWKVRWVVLDQKTVRYYKDEHDKEQLGMFELERVTNFWSGGNNNAPPKEAPPDLGHKLIFSLDVMDNGIREFVFCALSEADKYHWMQAFERNLAGVTKPGAVSPFARSTSPRPGSGVFVPQSTSPRPGSGVYAPPLSTSPRPGSGVYAPPQTSSGTSTPVMSRASAPPNSLQRQGSGPVPAARPQPAARTSGAGWTSSSRLSGQQSVPMQQEAAAPPPVPLDTLPPPPVPLSSLPPLATMLPPPPPLASPPPLAVAEPPPPSEEENRLRGLTYLELPPPPELTTEELAYTEEYYAPLPDEYLNTMPPEEMAPSDFAPPPPRK